MKTNIINKIISVHKHKKTKKMTAILFRTEISTLSLIQQKRRIGRESRASRRLLGNQKRKIEYKKDGKKRPIYYIKALLAQPKE